MMNRVLDEHLKPYLAYVRRKEDGLFAIHELEEDLRAVAEFGVIASIR